MAEDDIKCTYVRVARRLWIDERLRRVSEDARMLFMYLLTSPHGNMVGYYRLPAAYACSDLQWPMDRWSQALTELTKGVGDGPMVMYDAGSEVVLVRNYLRYNPIENRNQAIGATKTLVELPGNTLWPEFVAAIHRHAAKFTEPFTERFGERFTKGLGERYGNPVTVTVTETVAVTETVPAPRAGADAPEPVDNPSAGKRSVDNYTPEFEEFWSAYPRKREKGGAYKAWRARIREKAPPADLIAAARNYAAYCERKGTPTDFIKYGSTFLGKDKPFKDFINGIPPDEPPRVPRAYATLKQFAEGGEP